MLTFEAKARMFLFWFGFFYIICFNGNERKKSL